MPLWQVFHPTGTFTTPESKSALANSITSLYRDGPSQLPAFYVSVFFIPIDPENMFLGGEPIYSRSGRDGKPAKPFIRFAIDHIAVRQPDQDAAYARLRDRLDKVLKPFVADQGYDWEYHVDETERRLWKINGLVPPEVGSEGQKIWFKENYPVPLEDDQGLNV